MFMDGEANISVVGRRLVAMLEESLSSGGVRQTGSQSSLQPSTISLEAAAIQVLMALDQGPRQNFLSLVNALVLSASAGRTLLHLSAALGFEYLVKELLIRGMDADQCDENGFTPLHFAALYGHIDCARLMVREGANLEILDVWGHAAKHVALECHHHDIAEFLDAHELASAGFDEFEEKDYHDANDEPSEEGEGMLGDVGALDSLLTKLVRSQMGLHVICYSLHVLTFLQVF